MSALQIRALQTYDEIQEIMPLQRATWGDDEAGALVPAQMLIHLVRYGGHVLAAHLDGRQVGFIIGYLGLEAGRLVMASKRMVVAPPFRNRGIAMRLKLAQRELAIAQGVSLITWTFSPTMSLNAHFNLNKLGGYCRRYDRDVYGSDTPLAVMGNSDRLLVEYPVHSQRVRERAAGQFPLARSLAERLAHAPALINPSLVGPSNWRRAGPIDARALDGTTGSAAALVELPANFNVILAEDRTAAAAWQAQLRELLLECLNGRGFAITEIWHGQRAEHEARRAFYLLERAPSLPLED